MDLFLLAIGVSAAPTFLHIELPLSRFFVVRWIDEADINSCKNQSKKLVHLIHHRLAVECAGPKCKTLDFERHEQLPDVHTVLSREGSPVGECQAWKLTNQTRNKSSHCSDKGLPRVLSGINGTKTSERVLGFGREWPLFRRFHLLVGVRKKMKNLLHCRELFVLFLKATKKLCDSHNKSFHVLSCSDAWIFLNERQLSCLKPSAAYFAGGLQFLE